MALLLLYDYFIIILLYYCYLFFSRFLPGCFSLFIFYYAYSWNNLCGGTAIIMMPIMFVSRFLHLIFLLLSMLCIFMNNLSGGTAIIMIPFMFVSRFLPCCFSLFMYWSSWLLLLAV